MRSLRAALYILAAPIILIAALIIFCRPIEEVPSLKKHIAKDTVRYVVVGKKHRKIMKIREIELTGVTHFTRPGDIVVSALEKGFSTSQGWRNDGGGNIRSEDRSGDVYIRGRPGDPDGRIVDISYEVTDWRERVWFWMTHRGKSDDKVPGVANMYTSFR